MLPRDYTAIRLGTCLPTDDVTDVANIDLDVIDSGASSVAKNGCDITENVRLPAVADGLVVCPFSETSAPPLMLEDDVE